MPEAAGTAPCPGLIVAFDTPAFQRALQAVASSTEIIGDADVGGLKVTTLAGLEAEPTATLDAVRANTNADTIAKFLLTSGSTRLPKAVITTNRMLCSNAQMLRQPMPFLVEEPPVLLDWLPWNHSASSQAVTSRIEAGGSISSISQRDTTLEGTQLESGGDTVIAARNLNIKAAQDTNSSSSDSTHIAASVRGEIDSTGKPGGNISGEYSTSESQSSASNAVVGTIKSGVNVNVTTTGDTRLEGTRIESEGDTTIGRLRENGRCAQHRDLERIEHGCRASFLSRAMSIRHRQHCKATLLGVVGREYRGCPRAR